ncbi:MAG: bifunctional prepilin peptidase / N-methyltransferase PilD [Rhodobacteraceae bacterium HLUCCA12]|nr:MAG: bifunctional prepilin peptidase / N-methyltransferase PilD [Rhodobacteraceae bacterium HLUCCA12]
MIAPWDEGVRLLVVLVGPAAGSFAALLADRLPRGEPVVMARSRCRGCGARLQWQELLPIWSWLVQRGRCRHCGAPIPARLLHAEVIGLLFGLGAALVGPTSAVAVLGAMFLWCLLALALADLRFFRLPDPLTGVLAGLGLALALAGDGSGWPDWPQRLAAGMTGAALGGGSFWILRTAYRRLTGREGMGLGDVKLMAGIGAGLGAQALPMTVLLAGLSALVLAVLRALRRGRALRRAGRVPFGAFLAIAAAAVWLLPLAR